MSLRDQLLQVGLISAKQAKEAERQQQQQERQQNPRRKPDARASKGAGQAPRGATHGAHSAERGAAAAVASATPRPSPGPPPPVPRANPALSAKVARDQDLNRKQQEKAHKKALQDQIRQLIEKNRLPPIEGRDSYNFVDGSKIRRIGIDAATRGRLTRGDIAIVLHAGRYDLVPLDVANRIRERDARAVIVSGGAQAAGGTETTAAEEGYEAFAVPDDLIW